ncbi:hypothetical protein Dimus_001902, partial [Dionaea muscipula]
LQGSWATPTGLVSVSPGGGCDTCSRGFTGGKLRLQAIRLPGPDCPPARSMSSPTSGALAQPHPSHRSAVHPRLNPRRTDHFESTQIQICDVDSTIPTPPLINLTLRPHQPDPSQYCRPSSSTSAQPLSPTQQRAFLQSGSD